MRVSIIIRAYNEAEHLEKLLAGINAQTLKPAEVILVDSGSTDETVDIATHHGAKIVEIAKQEFTFGRALNVGCDVATGEICVFVSAHAYPVCDDWLERLIAPFSDDRVVLSYGRQRGNALNKFSERQVFAKWFPSESVSPQRSSFCNNANCAIRRSAWLVQRYDETLTGLEDVAWAKAAQRSGGWIAYVSDAEIIHVHDETWSQVRNRYRREAIAMRAIEEGAKFSLLDFVMFLTGNIAADLCAAWRGRVLSKEWLSIVLFRVNQHWGTYVGYNGPRDPSAELRMRFYYPPSEHDRRIRRRDASREINYESLLGNRVAAGDSPEAVAQRQSQSRSIRFV